MTSDAPLVPPRAVEDVPGGLAGPVAVTGGTGFVGSHLVDTLCAAGLRPRVLVRDPDAPRWIAGRPVEWVPGSLHDPGALERLVAGAGTVFHLAGVVRAPSAAAFHRGNCGGTANLVAAVRRAAPDARLVHVSSQAALGPSPERAGLGPEAVPHPVSAYGRSKLAAEEEVRALGETSPWVILRPPAIYGPRDTDVLQFFKLAAAGVVPLPWGERWVTMAFVGDVVRAVLAAAGREVAPGRIHHLGEPEPYRMTAMVRLLAEAGGVRARVLPLPPAVLTVAGLAGSGLHLVGFGRVPMTRDKARELTARHWTLRTRDSLEALGLSQWTEFFDGARLTWEWYREVGWLR